MVSQNKDIVQRPAQVVVLPEPAAPPLEDGGQAQPASVVHDVAQIVAQVPAPTAAVEPLQAALPHAEVFLFYILHFRTLFTRDALIYLAPSLTLFCRSVQLAFIYILHTTGCPPKKSHYRNYFIVII